MEFLALTISAALIVWGGIALVRGSVFLSTALFLASTSCLPAEFFSIDAGGLTWTFDRLFFLFLLAQVAVAWYRGQLRFGRLEYSDVAIGLFFLWLVARTITQPWGSAIPGQPPTLMHFVNGYLIPFSLYAVLRTSRLDYDQLKPVWILLVLLAMYLSITAFLEIANAWTLVFPKFIADPSLGIHYGRARGPMLQSVRLGIFLIVAWASLAIYTVWLHPKCRFRWIAFSVGTFLFAGAIFLTYTRSVWLGLAFSLCVLVLLGLQGLSRRAAIFGMLCGCVLIGAVKGPDLIAFKREFSAAETRESTYMRAAFAYVSLEMFQDRPVAGFGFNQFQVHNGPYLSDRSTNLRVNSIRGYVHHNSYLSLLVDLGMVGLALYGFVALTTASQAWSLWRSTGVPQWVQGLALLAFATGGSHLIQMAFHEVSYSSIENGFLFTVCGLVGAARQQFCMRQPHSEGGSADEREAS